MTPSFLKNAKRLQLTPIEEEQETENSQNQTPSFLKNAKKISQVPTQQQNIPLENENDLDREIERNIARQTSRGLETIAGLPGDIESFGRYLLGNEEESILPTSSKLKETSEKLTGGYTSPKSDFEKKSDEFISDIASFAIPGSKTYSLLRNIGIPIVGNLVKEGLNYGNADESSKAAGKIGTMVLIDLLTQRKGGAKKYTSDLFNKADHLIKHNPDVDVRALFNSLEKLEETMKLGGEKPSTAKALQKIEELKKESIGGFMPIKNLMAYRPAINEAIDSLGGFNIELPKKIRKRAIDNLNQVKSNVISTAENYGEKLNPEFLENYRAANEAYAAYENSNKIAKFLKKNVAPTLKSTSAKILLGTFGGGVGKSIPAVIKSTGPLGVAGLGAAAAGSAGAYEAFKIVNRMKNSPVLRKYYLQTLKSAASGNVSQTIKNSKALDNKLAEEGYD